MEKLKDYSEIWFVDFEFQATVGERPNPICMVARELRTNRLIRLFKNELAALSEPPFSIAKGSLIVAFYVSAELGCFLSLKWSFPDSVLDLFPEFSWITCGIQVSCGKGLLGAMEFYGLDGISTSEKRVMRELAMRGGPFTQTEQQALLEYCQADVDALAELLPKILIQIDLPRALLRSRYMKAVAKMEWNGIPIDTETSRLILTHWNLIKTEIIRRIDPTGEIYEGQIFKVKRFAEYLSRRNIDWSTLVSGVLALDDNTFREMALRYPKEVGSIRELRQTLSQLRLGRLAIGSDGRNRCLLSPFRSKTSRNQPSNARSIFGPSAWIRSLIKPPPGSAIAYVDWSQQEFGLAAFFSKDEAMIDAYISGDPYLSFAIQAGAAPIGATKNTHGQIRNLYKTCALAVQYGMQSNSLARSLGILEVEGCELIKRHKATYPKYWEWSQSVLDFGTLKGKIHSVFGWQLNVSHETKPTTLKNWPLQTAGAEMMRLAAIMLTETGIRVCFPVHDAFLVEGPVEKIDDIVKTTQSIMKNASMKIMPTMPLRTDVEIIRYPNRYTDPRGKEMWRTVTSILSGLGSVSTGLSREVQQNC